MKNKFRVLKDGFFVHPTFSVSQLYAIEPVGIFDDEGRTVIQSIIYLRTVYQDTLILGYKLLLEANVLGFSQTVRTTSFRFL